MQVITTDHQNTLRQQEEVHSRKVAAVNEENELQLKLKDAMHQRFIQTSKEEHDREKDAKLEALRVEHQKELALLKSNQSKNTQHNEQTIVNEYNTKMNDIHNQHNTYITNLTE